MSVAPAKLDHLTALARLCRRLGGSTAGADEWDGDALEGAVAALRAGGQPARLVRVPAREWGRLRLPSLVAIGEGEPALVTGVSSGRIDLELADGSARRIDARALERACGGRAVELAPPLATRGGFLARFARALATERRRLGALALLLLPLAALELAAPWAIQLITDHALPDGASGLLGVLALGTVVVSLHRAWLAWLRAQAQRQLQASLDRQTLRDLLAHVLRLPYAALQARRVGEVGQALGAASSVGGLLVRLVLLPAEDGLRCLASFVCLLFLQPAAALWLAGALALALPLAALLAARHGRMLAAEMQAGAAQQSYLYELVRGATTVRAMGATRVVGARWLGRLVDEQAASLRRLRAALWLDVLFEAARQLAAWAFLIAGASRCLAGEMTVGTLLASLAFAGSFADAALRFGQAFFQISSNAPAVRRIDALLALPADAPTLPAPAGPRPPPAVLAEDVWFRYGPDEPWVLRGQRLEVPAGATLCLRGISGCGKTTLLRLLAGLLTPERGRIAIGGRAPREARDAIIYLPQDAHLFEGSLLTNLTLLSGAPAAHCLAAARRTGLDAWVQTLPMGYETLVPAGGWNVSGGQRQLVLLTAAVASDRPLVLLDEAHAHLDRIARGRLARDDLFAGKTVITIVHEDEGAGEAPSLTITT